MKNLHPDLTDWMIQDGYGKVLSRNGLSLVERELISVAMLAALGWERQLRSHVVGSVNVGSSRKDVTAVLRSISASISGKRFKRALLMVERASEKKTLIFWAGEGILCLPSIR
jgi:4-carboxymuconolactone decarboxylase